MPVSGLVLTLTSDREGRQAVITALEQEPRVEIGPLTSGRLAIVVDTQSSDEDREVWQWLNGLPGVEFVDVALVGFE